MTPSPHKTSTPWQHLLRNARARLHARIPLERSASLRQVSGLALHAAGLRASVGAQCWIAQDGQTPLLGEVVGFAGQTALLMPAGDTPGLRTGARVTPVQAPRALPGCAPEAAAANPQENDASGVLHLPVGTGLFGCVLDAQGRILDGGGRHLEKSDAALLPHVQPAALRAVVPGAMQRAPIRQALDVGVRAVNALFTVGRGQRLGLFAGAGVGKSTLLGMMARHTQADAIVVGLIGERSREVQEFVQDILPRTARQRAIVIAAPASSAPLLRLQGAHYASRIAEHLRDQGLHVLLLMDSLTRYAQAQREIALAVGEPPATKGYPPSCFAKLCNLVERSGNGAAGGGSITAFYTVLVEGDDPQEPVADAARAILDGHITLSRELAEAGHYPAIDPGQSISRVMHRITEPEHAQAAQRFRALHARWHEVRDLLRVGAYAAGSDAQLDEAIARQAAMHGFLRQDMREAAALPASIAALHAVLHPAEAQS